MDARALESRRFCDDSIVTLAASGTSGMPGMLGMLESLLLLSLFSTGVVLPGAALRARLRGDALEDSRRCFGML